MMGMGGKRIIALNIIVRIIGMKKFFRKHWGVLGIAAAIVVVVAVALCLPNGFGLDAAAETTSHPDGAKSKP